MSKKLKRLCEFAERLWMINFIALALIALLARRYMSMIQNSIFIHLSSMQMISLQKAGMCDPDSHTKFLIM